LGLRSLQAAEVLEGLSAGDTVLLDNRVQPGQRVRPREVTSAEPPVAVGGQAGAAGAALGNAMGR